jgi:hypothetical protein
VSHQQQSNISNGNNLFKIGPVEITQPRNPYLLLQENYHGLHSSDRILSMIDFVCTYSTNTTQKQKVNNLRQHITTNTTNVNTVSLGRTIEDACVKSCFDDSIEILPANEQVQIISTDMVGSYAVKSKKVHHEQNIGWVNGKYLVQQVRHSRKYLFCRG